MLITPVVVPSSQFDIETNPFLRFHHDITKCETPDEAWSLAEVILSTLECDQVIYMTIPPHGLRSIQKPEYSIWQLETKVRKSKTCPDPTKTREVFNWLTSLLPTAGTEQPYCIQEEYKELKSMIMNELNIEFASPYLSQVYGPGNHNGFFILHKNPPLTLAP